MRCCLWPMPVESPEIAPQSHAHIPCGDALSTWQVAEITEFAIHACPYWEYIALWPVSSCSAMLQQLTAMFCFRSPSWHRDVGTVLSRTLLHLPLLQMRGGWQQAHHSPQVAPPFSS